MSNPLNNHTFIYLSIIQIVLSYKWVLFVDKSLHTLGGVWYIVTYSK